MSDRLSLASSTGWPLALLAFHVMMGVIGLLSGTVAIVARKGGSWHRRSGTIFVGAMVAMGVAAVGVSVFEGKDDVAGGALAAYLVFTAWITVRPLRDGNLTASRALLAVAVAGSAALIARGVTALGRPGNQIEGVPAGMMFFLGTVMLLAAVGDLRVMRAGGIQGARRLARHLWRMCFGLFIATGSFVAQLTRMTFIPHWMRGLPAILLLSAGPLVVLLYWMWRVRFRQNLRGLVTAKPLATAEAA